MALIVTNYDLSGGNTYSTEVVAPNDWRVTVTVDSAPVRQVTFFHLEIEDEQGNWALLKDDKEHPVQFSLKGNGTTSKNVLVVNAANGRVKIKPPNGATGNVNVDSITT